MELMPPKGKGIHFTGHKQWTDGYSDGPPSAEDLDFGFAAPAEDAITSLAQYYGVPCVSIRNAIFQELKAGSGNFPLKKVFHDRHHPGAWGHSLLAQMVVELLGITAARLADGNGDAAATACAADGALGNPLFAPSAEAGVSTCVKGEGIMSLVLSARGFAYKVEGQDAKMEPGLVGTAPGDEAQLCIDVSRLPDKQTFVVILGHLISYEHMGVAAVQCLGACECGATEVDAHVPGGQFSVFKAKSITVRSLHLSPRALAAALPVTAAGRAGCGCVLQLTILKRTGSGEHKFKVLSLMTAAREGSLRYGHQTGFNVRPMKARTD